MSEKPVFLNPHYDLDDLSCVISFSLTIFSSITMELKYPSIQCCY